MLERILRHINNWFLVPGGVHTGDFTVQDGGLALPFLQEGQYFRVVGSLFNDGVYQYPEKNMHDESFTGAVWALATPIAVLDLAARITEWETKNGAAATGPYQSESFGGYSYTRATDSATGGAVTWESAFREELNQWRKLK